MSRNEFTNLVPAITESRLARQYDAIRTRMPATPGRVRGGSRLAGLGWALAATSTLVLAVVVFWARSGRNANLVDEAVLESGGAVDGASGMTVTLADGSSVQLGTATRARLTSARPKAIRIDLERGAIEIEATHMEGRTFVVGAGGYDVHVVGTHFSVQRDPNDRVTVRVDRGVVEVAAANGNVGETRRLAAGESWSALDGASAHASLPPPPAPAQPAIASPSPSNQAPAAPVAQTVVGTAGTTTGGPSRGRDENARELFDDAQRARADGRSEDAARAFDRLRRTFPRDPRSALAAFELGRLRLDVLGDPRGAEEALRDAIALGPSSPFREDAEARRVEALSRLGDTGACTSARAAYLARWPNGTYRRAVEVGCGAR
jgi:transmembrane sensor